MPTPPVTRTLLTACLLAGALLHGPSVLATSGPAPAASAPVARAPLRLQSATSLAFGPDGVLFIGDSLGSAVYALDVGERGLKSTTDAPVTVQKLDDKVAALLGTRPDDIVITDMKVNPASQNIYLAVHRGRGPRPQVALLRIRNGTDRLEVVALDTLAYTSARLPHQVSAQATLEFGTPQRVLTITNLLYHGGELFVAGITNEEFASTLRRIPYPFNGTLSASTLEIYHTVHNQFETRAPIVTQLVQNIGGQPYLIAAYTCTPVVRFKLADLKDGAHVRGETIAELGYGNAPVDMVGYTDPYDNKPYLLVTNDQRSATKIDAVKLEGAPALTRPTINPQGLDQQQIALSGALQLDILNARYAVVVRRNVLNHDLYLMSVNNGWFFDRSESIVEYNWPGIKNPFVEGYNLIDNHEDYRNLTDNKSAR